MMALPLDGTYVVYYQMRKLSDFYQMNYDNVVDLLFLFLSLYGDE